ncbi:PspC domain-containing protein [Corynebacterium aquilae]|uniref:PspC domain-containing protein n=1 Tax=Corynebacterium aquilae TaxID=203263 RepID=UPI00095303B5|nr:PspC domain-containing protein [Corynebacterium aquilae]
MKSHGYPADNGYVSISHPHAARLTRDTKNKMIAGVCAGLGRTYNINVTLLRVLFVASLVLPGAQVLLYAVLWAVIPRG